MKLSSMNLILWGCVIWMPALFYVLLSNETKFKKNIAIGVTFPQEAREDAELQHILSVFKKHLLYVCLGLFAIAIPCVFIPSTTGIAMTIWMIWLLLGCVLPYIPYIQCNRKLKQLKENRGWKQQSSQMQTIDLRAASIETRWLSPHTFLLPAAVSLLPLLFDTNLAIIYLLDAALIVFCWFGYRYLYRNKSEIVDENIMLTEALTRIRRYNWGRMWLLCSWFMAALNLLAWLTQANAALSLTGILLLSILLVAASIYIELKLRKLQETLTAQSGTGFYIDDDDKWIWGMFYYDPNDTRLLINNRVGMNTTVNLAKRSGQFFMGITLLSLLAMPFLGVWMDKLETTPVGLEISESAIVSTHTGIEYEIPLDAITYIEYVSDRPKLHRTAGTGMATVQKGRYSTPWGSASICLDPRTTPYIYIETGENKRYLFGSADAAETEAVYQQLMNYQN